MRTSRRNISGGSATPSEVKREWYVCLCILNFVVLKNRSISSLVGSNIIIMFASEGKLSRKCSRDHKVVIPLQSLAHIPYPRKIVARQAAARTTTNKLLNLATTWRKHDTTSWDKVTKMVMNMFKHHKLKENIIEPRISVSLNIIHTFIPSRFIPEGVAEASEMFLRVSHFIKII
jgi:hypothetical protein